MDKTSVLRDMIFPQAEKVRHNLMPGMIGTRHDGSDLAQLTRNDF